MILAGFGRGQRVRPLLRRKRLFGYWFVAGSSIAIAVLGFLVWGHHMFVAGISMYGGLIFSLLSFAVAVPSAIKVFNWTADDAQGIDLAQNADALRARLPRACSPWAGLTGLFLATLAVDVHVTTPISSSRIFTTSWSAAW